jgi:hypothetical protein
MVFGGYDWLMPTEPKKNARGLSVLDERQTIGPIGLNSIVVSVRIMNVPINGERQMIVCEHESGQNQFTVILEDLSGRPEPGDNEVDLFDRAQGELNFGPEETLYQALMIGLKQLGE